VPLAGLEIVQPPDVHVRADVGDLRLDLRLDATDQRGAQIFAAAQHALHIEIGRDTLHVGLLAKPLRQRLPIPHALGRSRDRRVRREAQQPPPHLVPQAIHDRDDGDQRGDADTDAEHRDPADEGNEKAAVAAHDVTQAHVDGHGMKHKAGKATAGDREM
jgi:hypothetical protein